MAHYGTVIMFSYCLRIALKNVVLVQMLPLGGPKIMELKAFNEVCFS